MAESMVETIARAIYEAELRDRQATYHGDMWAGLQRSQRRKYIEAARAVLEALKTPTEGMVEAGQIPGWDDVITIGLAEQIYTAMIQAALNEGEGK